MNSVTHFGSMPIVDFLTNYWQKQHLFVKNAIDCEHLIEANELAGLALESDVESRIVSALADNQWRVENGPFTETTFANLPERDWTLLVQAVDQWMPKISDLFERFDFIPTWRRDDVMISFAVPGGSVGPHYDQYDVFLLQAEGTRTWEIGPKMDHYSPRLESNELDLVVIESAVAKYETVPGDILYIPPGVAHWGVATSNSITISIGFRAPSDGEMLKDFGEHIDDLLGPDIRFTDPNRRALVNDTARITTTDISIVRQRLKTLIDQDDLLVSWFGSLMTEPKYDDLLPIADRLALHTDDGDYLVRDAVTRIAYFEDDGNLIWFCNGFTEPLDVKFRPIIALLSKQRSISLDELQPTLIDEDVSNWLKSLIEEGHFYVT